MDFTLLDALKNMVSQSAAVSQLDRVVILSLCDDIKKAYQQEVLQKVHERDSLNASETECALSVVSDLIQIAKRPVSNINSRYIYTHFSDLFANMFMEHGLVTQSDIDNFVDSMHIDTESDTVCFNFENQQIPLVGQSIGVFNMRLSDEICSRFLEQPVSADCVATDKILNLDKEHFVQLFVDDADLYNYCVLTVLRKATDWQLKDIYNKLKDFTDV